MLEHVIVLAVIALSVVVATNLLAARVPVPAPILQTLVGVLLAFVPGIPAVHLDPAFVLLAVLPMLVYAAAVELPWEDFRHNLRPIGTLAFGLVAATVVVVAAVAHAIVPGMSWAAALVLGAIVSPTDPVASTAVASRIGVPQRLVAIIEGEGLVNDAVALTIKAIALSAALGSTFSIERGLFRFGAIVVGEIAWGCAVGWVIATVRRHVEESTPEILITVITPFLAYLLPESLGGSGVLATVATGMYIGVRRPELVPSGTRLHLTSVWQVIVYALNGTLFLLMGLQSRLIWNGTGAAPGDVLWWGTAIAGTAIAVRFAWTWPAVWLPRLISVSLRRRDPAPPSRHLVFLAWSGMRGAISLAAAFSLPASFPGRPLIIFITACVIAATLIAQGTTLPWIIRLLRLDRDADAERERDQQAEQRARLTVGAAFAEDLQSQPGGAAGQVPESFGAMARVDTSANGPEKAKNDAEIQRHAIAAGRRRVIAMYRRGEIPHLVLRRVERDLDLQETLLANRFPP